MLLPDQTRISVAVFGEDSVAGRSLELLFQSVGYSARFLTEASFDRSAVLDGVHLLLFVGGLDAERREASTSFVERALVTAGIPILELASSLNGARVETGNLRSLALPNDRAKTVGRGRLARRTPPRRRKRGTL